MDSELPEIWVDFNARMTERGHLLTNGTLADLARLGLTPGQAVGRSFLFNGGADTDKDGHPADILCRGTIVADPAHGFLAERDGEFFWRRTA